MISVNRNFGSLVGRHNLLTANNAVETAVQRLSSGARINSAADDSAGMAVVSKMDSQIAGLSVAIKNTMDAISLFDTASAGLQTTSAIAQRVRELAVQNSNGHLSAIDRAAGQLEVGALNAELLRIAEDTNFNKIGLLDGTLDTTMQIGNTVSETLSIAIDGVETATPIAATAAATGSSLEVLRPTATGTASSTFDTPATSRASGTSVLDYLSSSTAVATSAFDTPAASNASGSSSLDVPAAHSTVTTLTSTATSSSRSVLPANSASSVTSALDYLTSTAVTDPSDRWSDPSSSTTGIPSSSSASVTTASALDTLNFAGGTFSSGWDIVGSQIELGSSGSVNTQIGGYAPPTDAEPVGSAGDSSTAQVATSLGNSSIDFNYSASASSMTLSTNEIQTVSKGIVHGPAMISSDAIWLNSADVVSFDWEFTGVGSAGDYADVYAYLLNTSDGSTVELTDYTASSSGGTGTISVSQTLSNDDNGNAIDGLYKFVFVSGAYDNDGGTIVGSEVIVSNLSVTDTGTDSKTSTASTTLEAQESSAVSIGRSSLSNLDSAVISDGSAGTYAISGTDASLFSIDSNGDITSAELLRTNKTSYSFDVTYTRSDGGYHKESVTLNLTPAQFATTTAYAQESDQVSIALSDMSELNTYVSTNLGGAFSIASTGSDYSNFSINSSTGVITSGALDFDSQSVYNFDVLYTVGGDTYTNSIVLNLLDTLTSTTTVSVEETDQLTINYSDLTGTQDFVSRNPGGTYSLGGDDAGMFTLDGSNNLVSSSGVYLAESASRTVQLLYTVGGVTHTDTITISVTEALQAESDTTVASGSSVTITPSETAFAKIYAYAQANSGGTWSLASNSADPSDYLDFSINSSTGVVTSNAALDYSVESSHIFDVRYTQGGTTFTETVTINVADPSLASSITSMTAEETDALTIPASNFTSTASFVLANGAGGTYSLTGTNASSFDISNAGVVTNKSGVSLRIGSTEPYNYYDTYDFNVVYTIGGSTSTEAVKLTITETLVSSQTLTAAESSQVNASPSSNITGFAGRDRNAGTYSLSSSSGDHSLFNVDSDGNISSVSALDYDTQKTYAFDLNYLASDGRTFVETIALTLTDTLSSTAAITTEETESLTIPIAQLTSSQTYQAAKPGGTFSLSGTDLSYFDVNSSTGEITTKTGQSLVQTDKSSYSVTLNYLDTFGATHSEVITITLTEALQGTSSFSADESDLVTIYLDDLTKIRGFASRDGNNGSFLLGGADAASFTINSDGNIESTGALDYSTQDTYVFTLSYTEAAASGSDTFVDTITLTLNDTLTSTATVSAEETESLTIAASEFTSTATYVSRNPGSPAGTYSITGVDAASFSVDASGNITSTGELRYLTQSSYNFNILYTADGITHTEAVTLNLTETTYQISATNVSVIEADTITITNTLMSHLNEYASSDGYNGNFTLTTATVNGANDHVYFEIDASGNIQNISSYDVDFDNGQTSFDMDVIYTHSDLVTTYTDRLSITLLNDYSDDTDLVLASVDISTATGAREAMYSIGSVIDRMSKTQVILGAKKMQLISNIERLSTALMQTQIARGRIFDADVTSEASRLAKQQILAGAASKMISLASAQKRGLIDMLI